MPSSGSPLVRKNPADAYPLDDGVGITSFHVTVLKSSTFAERLSSTQKWSQMSPESVSEAIDNAKDQTGWWGLYDGNYGESKFSFAGPFLTAQATVAAPIGYGQGGYGAGPYGGTTY